MALAALCKPVLAADHVVVVRVAVVWLVPVLCRRMLVLERFGMVRGCLGLVVLPLCLRSQVLFSVGPQLLKCCSCCPCSTSGSLHCD